MQFNQTFHQTITLFLGIFHQVFFKQVNRRHGGLAGYWITAEGRGMGSGFPVHNFSRGDHGAQGHTGGDALGDGDNVRIHLEMLHPEHFPGAPHAGLHFIGDIQDAVLFSNFIKFFVKPRRRYDIPALALDGFDKDGRHLFGRHRGSEKCVFHPVHAM